MRRVLVSSPDPAKTAASAPCRDGHTTTTPVTPAAPECSFGLFGGESISDPRLAHEVARLRGVGLDLLSQLPDEHPQVLGLVDRLRSPDRLQNRAVGDDPVRVAGEKCEEVELF